MTDTENIAAPAPGFDEAKIERLTAAGVFDMTLAFSPGPYNKNFWWYYQQDTTDDTGRFHHAGETINFKQGFALAYTGRELFYGGAGGGGKTGLIVMKALHSLHLRGFAALIIRRTMPEMLQPGGAIHLCNELLRDFSTDDLRFHVQEKQITSKEGGIIQFGHCERMEEIVRYLGGSYQFIAIDESTHIDLNYILSELYGRRRKRVNSSARMQIMCASNPGGPYEQQHIDRYIESTDLNRLYLPARFTDNLAIDQPGYAESLSEMPDAVRQQQLRDGIWGLKKGGGMMQPGDFIRVNDFSYEPPQVRSWDTAGTERRAGGRRSDETVGTLWRFNPKSGEYCIAHQIYFRAATALVEDAIELFMDIDAETGYTRTVEERPPGEAGIDRADRRQKRFAGRPYKCGGELGRAFVTSKQERCDAMAVAAQNHLVKLLNVRQVEDHRVQNLLRGKISRGYWIDRFLQQVAAMPAVGQPVPQSLMVDGCIAEGTLVETDCGTKPIETIRVGDFVLTRKGYRQVSHAALTYRNAATVKIVAGDNELEATPDHELWVNNREWMAISIIALGDKVLTCGEQCSKDFVPVQRKETGRCVNVYDLTVVGEHEFFAGNILVSNCDSASLGFNEIIYLRKPSKIIAARSVSAWDYQAVQRRLYGPKPRRGGRGWPW